MPLPELDPLAGGKIDISQEKNPSCSTKLYFIPESYFVELVWENVQEGKALMLDGAIEDLKTLQLQVQIMSMEAGLFMPPMMFLTSYATHAYSSHGLFFTHGHQNGGAGVGMGIPDLSTGSSCCPMIQAPSSQGAQFPVSPLPGATAFHGLSRRQEDSKV